MTPLYQKDIKAVSKADVDSATAALHSAQSEGAAAKADTAAAQAQIEVARAGVTNAQASVHAAQLQLSYTRILAPVAGKIGKKSVESGQRVQPGEVLMALVEPDVWVIANLKETQLADVNLGQKVPVEIDAIPDHEFRGHVDSFQPGSGASFALLPPDNATGNFTKIVQRVPVKTVFEPDSIRDYESRAYPGFPASPRSTCAPVRNDKFPNLARISAAALLLGLTSCSVGPPYHGPPAADNAPRGITRMAAARARTGPTLARSFAALRRLRTKKSPNDA